MLNLHVLSLRLKHLCVESMKETCDRQVEIHECQLFSNTTPSTTAERHKVFFQPFYLVAFCQPPFGLEGQSVRENAFGGVIVLDRHTNDSTWR